jgi:hypothetical protein
VRLPRLELRKAKTALTRPNIGNPDGRGRPGSGWHIEQLVIDEDGWPVIVDGTPGKWPDELSGEHRRHLEDLQDEKADPWINWQTAADARCQSCSLEFPPSF